MQPRVTIDRAEKLPCVLVPWNADEVMSVAAAAAMSRKTPRTIRDWAARQDIGRKVGGEWAISRLALTMWLENDQDALRLYLTGERRAEPVAAYCKRLNITF